MEQSNSCAECGNVSPSEKFGPHRSLQMQKLSGEMELMAGGDETPYREELELVRHNSDLRFEGVPMRRACYAEKSCDWGNYTEEFLADDKRSFWASAKVRECFSEVE